MADRTYNIPLRKEFMKVPIYRRSGKAVKAVREFLARHMRAEIENVRIGKWLNYEILKRGKRNPPHHVEVNVTKDGILVKAELKELPKKAIEEMKREEERKKELDKKKEEKKEEEQKKDEVKEEKKIDEDSEKDKILKKEVMHEKPAQPNVKQQKTLIKRKALQK